MTKDEVLLYRVEQLEGKLDAFIARYDEIRDAEERMKLVGLWWALGILGTFVTTLGGVIWSYRSVIFG